MNTNLQTGKKKNGCFKIGLIVIGVIFTLQFLIGGLLYVFESDEDKAKRENKIEMTSLNDTVNKIQSLNNSLDTLVKVINRNKDIPNLSHNELFLIIKGSKEVVDKGKAYNVDSINLKVDKLKKEIQKFQVNNFPIIRRKYVKNLNDKLWEHNVEVTCINNSCTKISFIGGRFASNGNIKEFQEEISSTLHDLRFKRVNYKWIKHDDEYTYYKIESKNDSEY